MRIAVTGLGAVSGFGRGTEAMWTALCEGRSALGAGPALPLGAAPGPLALVPGLPSDAPARATQLALDAAREALADAGELQRGPGLAIACGSTLGAIDGWLRAIRSEGPPPARWSYAAPAQAIAAEARAGGPVAVSSVACASGNVAIGTALDLLRSGRCSAVIAGGVDALSDFVIEGFAALKALDPERCRPFDRSRRGLNLGEGAGFLVLEREADALARGARVRALVAGWGVAADAVHMTGPDREGRGAARAITAALSDARVDRSELDFVSAHGTATAFNDLMEDRALHLALGERAEAIPVHSVKGALGHTLGAAGALEAIVCVRALQTGRIPATVGLSEQDPEIHLDVVRGEARRLPLGCVLSTSSGFGGTNAALVLRRP